MTSWRAASLIAAGLSLAACAELKQLDDMAMQKVLADRGQTGQLQPERFAGEMKVPKEANCGHSPAFPEAENCCLMPKYTAGMDVDTALAKARLEFNFQERKPAGEGAGYSHYHGWRYEANPGAFYRMAGDVVPATDVRLSRGVWVSMVLSKAGPAATDVAVAYCEARGRRMEDQLTWHKALQDAVRGTLPPIKKTAG